MGSPRLQLASSPAKPKSSQSGAAAAGPEDEARLNEAAVPPEAGDPAGRD